MVTYNYTVDDTLNDVVDPTILTNEIIAALGQEPNNMEVLGDVNLLATPIVVEYDSPINQTILDQVIAAHGGPITYQLILNDTLQSTTIINNTTSITTLGVDVNNLSNILDGYYVGVTDLTNFINGTGEGTTGFVREQLPITEAFPTQIIWWSDLTKTVKLYELNIVRDIYQKPLTETWYKYDTDGTTVLVTITDTMSYLSAFEVQRVRVVS